MAETTKNWWEDEKYLAHQVKESEEQQRLEQRNWDRTRSEELEDQAYSERQQDRDAERQLWGGVVIAMLHETQAVSTSVEAADKVLGEYRKRFKE